MCARVRACVRACVGACARVCTGAREPQVRVGFGADVPFPADVVVTEIFDRRETEREGGREKERERERERERIWQVDREIGRAHV